MYNAFFLFLFVWSKSILGMEHCNESAIEKFGFNYVIFKERPLHVISRRILDDHLDSTAIQLQPIHLESSIVSENVLVPLLEEQELHLDAWYAICGLRETNEGQFCQDCVALQFCNCDCAQDKQLEVQIRVSYNRKMVGWRMEETPNFFYPFYQRWENQLMYPCSKQRDPDCQKEGDLLSGFRGGRAIANSNFVGGTLFFTNISISERAYVLKIELFLETQKLAPLGFPSSLKISEEKIRINPREFTQEAFGSITLTPFQNLKESEVLCRQIENYQKEKMKKNENEKFHEKQSSGMKLVFDWFSVTLVIWFCFFKMG